MKSWLDLGSCLRGSHESHLNWKTSLLYDPLGEKSSTSAFDITFLCRVDSILGAVHEDSRRFLTSIWKPPCYMTLWASKKSTSTFCITFLMKSRLDPGSCLRGSHEVADLSLETPPYCVTLWAKTTLHQRFAAHCPTKSWLESGSCLRGSRKVSDLNLESSLLGE